MVEDTANARFVRSPMRADLRKIRNDLCEIAEMEATKLYRLAWRMQRHGCQKEHIEKCREEARELHMIGYPERLLDDSRRWQYAFRT